MEDRFGRVPQKSIFILLCTFSHADYLHLLRHWRLGGLGCSSACLRSTAVSRTKVLRMPLCFGLWTVKQCEPFEAETNVRISEAGTAEMNSTSDRTMMRIAGSRSDVLFVRNDVVYDRCNLCSLDGSLFD